MKTTSTSQVSRRSFLTWTAASAAGILAASCAQPTVQVIEKEVLVEKIVKETVVVEKQVPVEKVVKETVVVEKEVAIQKVVTASPVPVKYKEAPMLEALVKAGKLPPVDERLPEEPCVMSSTEGVGKLGGAIRRGTTGPSDGAGVRKLIRPGMVWFDAHLDQVPRVAKSWEVNADGSEWTFHLRKGMKWSDGEPFTTTDILWWWQNTETYKELKPAPSSYWVSGPNNNPATITAPDDYTVKFAFDPPKPMFLLPIGNREPWMPAHYSRNLHMDFVKDKAALEKEYKDKGFDSWVKYFGNRHEKTMNADLPWISGWVPLNTMNEELFIMERNPYYFGVDEEGQQLPYLDRIIHRRVGGEEALPMLVMNGEIDLQSRRMGFSNFTLYKEAEAKGDFKVFLGVTGTHVGLNINHTAKDPKVRALFQDRNVRLALSYAVDRNLLNELLYDGMSTPRQYSPLSRSAQSYPKLSNVHLEYDPAKANALLDEAGYDKKDSDGFRLWKDGSGPVSFLIEHYTATGTLEEDSILVVSKYLADVGIKATYKFVERALFTEHYKTNDVEATWEGGGFTIVPLSTPSIWLGRQDDRIWANAWYFWDVDPANANAEEPPADHWIRDIWNIWDNEVSAAADSKRQIEGFFRILDIWAEELPYPTFLGETPTMCIVKNGLKGFLAGYPLDDSTNDESILNLETYYWENPEAHV
ncbi:MAG: ABC transporter substrate-binding protein [Chloroflexi bacterium]|nr:ABC transporter substrate-binding protein [Chloroflexota bacterium]